jgi:GNAT superfamily N-acetyltransferase
MGDTIRVRLGVAGDVAAIQALTRAAYAKWVPVIGREPKPMTADYAVALVRHRFDLLYVGDELAALIETIACADHVLIENIAVAPAHQGRGFGRRLLDYTEQRAIALGHADIRLYTNQRFIENIELYRRRGYVVARDEVVAVGVIVHMAKPLPGAQVRQAEPLGL